MTLSIALSKPLSANQLIDIAHAMGGDSVGIGNEYCISTAPYRSEYTTYFSFLTANEQAADDYDIPAYTRIKRGEASDDELIIALSRLPEHYNDFKKELFKIFNLPQLQERHLAAIAQEDASYAALLQRLKTLKHLPHLTDTPLYDTAKANVKTVPQAQYRVLKKEDPEQYLYTEDVALCIAVLIRNPANNSIALAHMDSYSCIKQIGEMREALQTTPGQPLEVSLWGGRQNKSEALAANILAHLEQYQDMTLVAADLCNPSRNEKNIYFGRNGATHMDRQMSHVESTARRILGLMQKSSQNTSSAGNNPDQGRGK